MDNSLIATRTLKIAVTVILIALVFTYTLTHSTLITASPDSVRFMHFWQVNADQLKSEGVNVWSTLKMIFISLRSSNAYDMNRGRLVQYCMYGVDGLTRWLLPTPMINVWMIAILILNSALIAWISTSALIDQNVRVNLFCQGWVVLVTSSLVLSPAILLIMYGKYMWVTFVLAFFVATRTIVKICWLVAAAFSDEIGLLATMVVVFLSTIRLALVYRKENSSSLGSLVRCFINASLFGIFASLVVFFVYYGVLSVIFGTGAIKSQGYIVAVGKKIFNIGAVKPQGLAISTGKALSQGREPVWWTIVNGLLWRAETLVIGTSSENRILTTIIGSGVLVVILTGVSARFRAIMKGDSGGCRVFNDWVRGWLNDIRGFFYTFWILMLILIVFVILRGGAGDFTHYSYPAVATLAVLLFTVLMELFPGRLVNIALMSILVIHLALLPRAVATADASLGRYLFPDGTVSREDIQAINRSVLELKLKKDSAFFDAFNNGQEIDFSGTWFYSRIRGHLDASGPYFPIQGTVKVFLWPNKIRSIDN